ncbi:MAG: hypothetical protein ACD_72C00414G0002 [uncultured bacterium]|nr:MAG: hypothetical protein ACD_72C00414G0002 [uncultured bacterium]
MQPTITPAIPPKKRNHFISYIKGYSIIAVLLIHMIDWSNTMIGPVGNWFKELLYPGVFFFMATSGSVVYIAYAKSETWIKPAKKLFWRGLQLIGIYYLYNIVKLFIFNFATEPFYWQYTQHGKMTLSNIITLQSYSVPISILLTIGVLVSLSPILLFITKKIKFSNLIISGLFVALLFAVYGYTWSGGVSDFLFSRNTIMFPIALWSIPFLAGYLLASFGFEEKKKLWLTIFAPLFVIFYIWQFKTGASLKPSNSMYPLQAYYIVASLFFVSMLFYLFAWCEKLSKPVIKIKLALIRFLGDYTLSVYIWHWIVVDVTIWLFFPHIKLIWVTVPIFLATYIYIKRAKFQEYLQNQV